MYRLRSTYTFVYAYVYVVVYNLPCCGVASACRCASCYDGYWRVHLWPVLYMYILVRIPIGRI